MSEVRDVKPERPAVLLVSMPWNMPDVASVQIGQMYRGVLAL